MDIIFGAIDSTNYIEKKFNREKGKNSMETKKISMTKSEKKAKIFELCLNQMVAALKADWDFRDNCTDADLWDIDFDDFDATTYLKLNIDLA